MKAETKQFFKKVILAGLVFGLIMLGMVFFINGVKAEDNKPFIKVPNDEWDSQVVFDTVQVCYQGTLRWVVMGNPNLQNTPPPYDVARTMTIHCFCVLDKIRTKYKLTPYTNLLGKDDPMNPQFLPKLFMTSAVECIKEHNTLSGLVVLDPSFNIDDVLKIDNETKNDTKIEVKPPDNNSGTSDSTPEQPKELPTEDAPLLNF